MTVFSRRDAWALLSIRCGAKPLVSLSSQGAEIAQVLVSQNHNVLLVYNPRSEFRSSMYVLCNYIELASSGVGLAPSDDVGRAHGDFFCPPAALGVCVTLPGPLALFADPPQHSRTCRGRMSCLH